MKRIRYYIFLQDVFVLALSAFGGPQAHLGMLFQRMVEKRAYLTEEELIELNALCQILPGPTSTQTIIALGFRKGGASLAFLTLMIWALPAGAMMTGLGVFVAYFKDAEVGFFDLAQNTRFIQPMAIGFISYAAYKSSSKVITTKTGWFLMVISAVIAYLLAHFYGHLKVTAFAFPLLLIIGGFASARKYRKQKRIRDKGEIKIDWRNFILFVAVFIVGGAAATYFDLRLIKIFENFYRNGSLVFGGGQVLIPLMKAEFVDSKNWLSGSEFLSGISFVQAMPGPVFSLCGYIGALAMGDHGLYSQILGGVIALVGIFLPGTFLIFFVLPMWDEVKKYRVVRASLEGVTAVGSGLVIAAVILLFDTVENTSLLTLDGGINILLMITTCGVMLWGKIPAPILILIGLAAGFVF